MLKTNQTHESDKQLRVSLKMKELEVQDYKRLNGSLLNALEDLRKDNQQSSELTKRYGQIVEEQQGELEKLRKELAEQKAAFEALTASYQKDLIESYLREDKIHMKYHKDSPAPDHPQPQKNADFVAKKPLTFIHQPQKPNALYMTKDKQFAFLKNEYQKYLKGEFTAPAFVKKMIKTLRIDLTVPYDKDNLVLVGFDLDRIQNLVELLAQLDPKKTLPHKMHAIYTQLISFMNHELMMSVVVKDFDPDHQISLKSRMIQYLDIFKLMIPFSEDEKNDYAFLATNLSMLCKSYYEYFEGHQSFEEELNMAAGVARTLVNEIIQPFMQAHSDKLKFK